ncbi:beta-hydroxylase, partial [Pseudomonas carnis]|nr:beta-hydroxylase [Pseudomonas carnis]
MMTILFQYVSALEPRFMSKNAVGKKLVSLAWVLGVLLL